MSRRFNGSTDFLTYSNIVVTGEPCTLSAWIYPTNVTGAFAIFCDGNASINEVGLLVVNGALWAFAQNPTNYNYATPTVGVSVNTWYHVCGVFVSSTLRYAYLNGGFRGQDTNSRAVSANLGAVRIGQRASNTNQKFAGLIAECAMWNLALSDAEVAALAKGASPFSLRTGPPNSNLVAYWPVRGIYNPEPDPIWPLLHNMVLSGTPSLGPQPPIPLQADYRLRTWEAAPAVTARSFAVLVG